jgi:hypothetical protein
MMKQSFYTSKYGNKKLNMTAQIYWPTQKLICYKSGKLILWEPW